MWTKNKIKSEVLSYVFIFLGVFGFKSTFFEPNHIPSGSMLPTMAIGDFILVNKMNYGLKVPFTEWFMDPVYITGFTPPKKGDIVVFEYPKEDSILFVKRIFAMPGDEVEVFNNRFFINGKEVEKEEVTGDQKKELQELYDQKGVPMEMKFYKVQTGETKHIIAENDAMPYHLSQNKLIVPEGHFFVMGDNRDFSSDSRVWGLVPFENLRGKALFVWFNMVYPWSKEAWHFRPWRIGTGFGSLE